MGFYSYAVKDGQQNDVSLDRYRGKVVLVVNTATRCGYTPQYAELEALHATYNDGGLEILDFPCNQFMGQAPESDSEIQEFCQLNYNTKFDTFAKLEVNGANAHPLFQYLKEQMPQDQENASDGILKKTAGKLMNAIKGTDIKWNFTKFLVDREGNVVARFAPGVSPKDLSEPIAELLSR